MTRCRMTREESLVTTVHNRWRQQKRRTEEVLRLFRDPTQGSPLYKLTWIVDHKHYPYVSLDLYGETLLLGENLRVKPDVSVDTAVACQCGCAAAAGHGGDPRPDIDVKQQAGELERTKICSLRKALNEDCACILSGILEELNSGLVSVRAVYGGQHYVQYLLNEPAECRVHKASHESTLEKLRRKVGGGGSR